jgi:hypothetical protein
MIIVALMTIVIGAFFTAGNQGPACAGIGKGVAP